MTPIIEIAELYANRIDLKNVENISPLFIGLFNNLALSFMQYKNKIEI